MNQLLRFKLALAAIIFSGVALAFAVTNTQTVSAAAIQDCSTNSIIKCGISSPTNLITKIKAGKPADLDNIYKHFNIPTTSYDQFAKEAVLGTAYKNGNIVVDGKIVATDAWSIGRESKSYSESYKIDGETYYASDAKDVFNIESMPVYVWFNSVGQVTAAILQPCGNPMGGNVINPEYSCKALTATAVSGKKNTYNFTTNAPATKGATVSKVVYDFGDGFPPVTKTKPSDVALHIYSKPGTYTAKVTVYVKLPGGKEVVAPGAGCVKQITIKEEEKPPVKPTAVWACTNLTATPQNQSDNSYSYIFRANASLENATLVDSSFDFGDGVTASNIKPAGKDDNTVSTSHVYTKAGTYTTKATLNFKANDGSKVEGSSTSATCETTVTITPPVTPPTPTPTTPTELPKTGIAGVAGLFGGASVLGAVGYRWRASRKLNKVDDMIKKLWD